MSIVMLRLATRVADIWYAVWRSRSDGGLVRVPLTSAEYAALALPDAGAPPRGPADAEFLYAGQFWQWDTPSRELEPGCLTAAWGHLVVEVPGYGPQDLPTEADADAWLAAGVAGVRAAATREGARSLLTQLVSRRLVFDLVAGTDLDALSDALRTGGAPQARTRLRQALVPRTTYTITGTLPAVTVTPNPPRGAIVAGVLTVSDPEP